MPYTDHKHGLKRTALAQDDAQPDRGLAPPLPDDPEAALRSATALSTALTAWLLTLHDHAQLPGK